MSKSVVVWTVALVAGLALLGVGSTVYACSSHGSEAANGLRQWIASNFSGGTITVSATGSQTRDGGSSALSGPNTERNVLAGDGGHGGWNANAEYWLDIILPGDAGGTFTVRYVAPGDRFSQGGSWQNETGVEGALYKAGKTRIQDWFKNFQPSSQPDSGGFVG